MQPWRVGDVHPERAAGASRSGWGPDRNASPKIQTAHTRVVESSGDDEADLETGGGSDAFTPIRAGDHLSKPPVAKHNSFADDEQEQPQPGQCPRDGCGPAGVGGRLRQLICHHASDWVFGIVLVGAGWAIKPLAHSALFKREFYPMQTVTCNNGTNLTLLDPALNLPLIPEFLSTFVSGILVRACGRACERACVRAWLILGAWFGRAINVRRICLASARSPRDGKPTAPTNPCTHSATSTTLSLIHPSNHCHPPRPCMRACVCGCVLHTPPPCCPAAVGTDHLHAVLVRGRDQLGPIRRNMLLLLLLQDGTRAAERGSSHRRCALLLPCHCLFSGLRERVHLRAQGDRWPVSERARPCGIAVSD